jgi:hypothetical protein
MAKTLKEKREQMIGFLLENIVAKDIERQGNDIVVSAFNGNQYFIKTVSKQKDFPCDFEEDPKKFDKDRERLRALFDEVGSFIEEKNTQGLIPGFVFLRAETDYAAMQEKGKVLVNYGHFLKQELASDLNVKPDWDTKRLDPLELVVQQFYKRNSASQKQRRLRRGVAYNPELNYFNTKENRLEVVWFGDVEDPQKFIDFSCPVCDLQDDVDHSACKRKLAYREYVAERDEARYSKSIWTSKIRRSKESRCRSDAQKGIRLKQARLDDVKLHLPSKELYIAVVK